MAPFLRPWPALAAFVAASVAESIIPSNWTAQDAATTDARTLMMQISVNERMVPLAPVLALTARGVEGVPPTGLSGPLLLADPSNVLDVDSDNVAFISCDNYPGEIQADDVFDQAWQENVTAVVFYSRYSDWCHLTSYSESYPWVYTLKNRTDTAKMLDEAQNAGSSAVYATIGALTMRDANNTAASTPGGGNSNGNSGDDDSHKPPGTPSTAVAMIILYSITGVISALFMVIIITGALRAHRHPERYGPRNTMGRPRQSRARGIARAMIDTLPIVKTAEPKEPKPTDVELAETSPDTDQATRDASVPNEQHPENRNSIEEGIAAAQGAQRPDASELDPDHLGCSICTEDFQAGEDQRVLPCDHRFHPACVDPWLLNVSGTCPLCRIDLRPQPEDTGEVDADGNPIMREAGAEATPAEPAAQTPRMGVRRSILEGLRDLGRPNHRVHYNQQGDASTREDRLAVLRQMRHQRLADPSRRRSMEETAEEERSTRQRLRRVLGVRTRRTGPEGQTVAVDAEPTRDGASDEAVAPQRTSGSRFAEGLDERTS